MKDKTMLELIDRLVATNNRLTMAEAEVEKWKADYAVVDLKLDAAQKTITSLNYDAEKLKGTITEKEDSVSYWYRKANQLEKELNELKQMVSVTTGGEAPHEEH